MRRSLALVAVLAGVAHAQPPVSSPVREAQRLIDQWRIEEAVEVMAPLLRDRPDDPEASSVDANLRFLRGDYAGAASRIKGVIARGDAPGDARAMADLYDATAEATHGYAEARSPGGHFLLRYAPGRDEVLVPYAGETLEAAWAAIGRHDFADPGATRNDPQAPPVRVEIYPEIADLAKVSTLTLREIETSGTIALCKFNRLMIVSPRALGRGYAWLDTLAHEYTHFVVSRVSRNTVPIWLHEGLAKFEEQRWRREAAPALTPMMEHLLASALGRGKRLITFDEMYPSMAKLPSQADTALAFAEVFTVVQYLLERKGWEGVRAVIDRMREGQGGASSDASAVAGVLGESFADFQGEWKAWLRARKLRPRPGLVASSLKFVKAEAGKPGNPHGATLAAEDDDTQDIFEEKARKLARLGGMLRARGRLGPAAVEYEKAQALVGPGHPSVGSKLARTLLELGDPDRAIQAATPVAELYADLAGPAATLGEAWWKKGDGKKAAPWLEAAIRVSPFDPAPHCALAAIYAAAADGRAAREKHACEALGP